MSGSDEEDTSKDDETILKKFYRDSPNKTYQASGSRMGTKRDTIIRVLKDVIKELKTAKAELIKVVKVLETTFEKKETMKSLSLLKLEEKDRNFERGEWLHSNILSVLEQCSDQEEFSSLSHIVDTVLYNINSFVLPRDGQDILVLEKQENQDNDEIKDKVSDSIEDDEDEENKETDKYERKKIARDGKDRKGIEEQRKHPLVSKEETITKFKKIDRSSWGKNKKKMGFPEIGIYV